MQMDMEIDPSPTWKGKYVTRATLAVGSGIVSGFGTAMGMAFAGAGQYALTAAMAICSGGMGAGTYNLMRFAGVDDTKSLLYSIGATELMFSGLSVIDGRYDISSLLSIAGATALGGTASFFQDQRSQR